MRLGEGSSEPGLEEACRRPGLWVIQGYDVERVRPGLWQVTWIGAVCFKGKTLGACREFIRRDWRTR